MNTAVGVTSGRQGRGQGLLLPQRHGDCRAPAARHPPVPFCVCMCPYVCVCVVMCDLMCPCNNMGTIGHPLHVILRCPSVSLCVRMCDLICSRNSGLGLMSTYGASDRQAYMARQAGRHTHPRAHGYIKKKKVNRRLPPHLGAVRAAVDGQDPQAREQGARCLCCRPPPGPDMRP